MRLLSCIIGVLIGNLVLGLPLMFAPGCLMMLMLVVMYIILRPVMQVIIMPFNMFLFGILTIATDALFVLWAAAWTPGYIIAYWQALIIAGSVWVVYTAQREIFCRPDGKTIHP